MRVVSRVLGSPGGFLASLSSALFVLQLPGTQGVGSSLLPDIPTPNLRDSCTPRCADVSSGGGYRCDTDSNGQTLCNTFELEGLEGEHECHFHYHDQAEVASCLANSGVDTMIFVGAEWLQGLMATVAPWLDADYNPLLFFPNWVFDGAIPGELEGGDPGDICVQLLIDDATGGLVDRKAALTGQDACFESVYPREAVNATAANEGANATTTDAGANATVSGEETSFVFARARSPLQVMDQLDLLQGAGRGEDAGYIIISTGTWIAECLNSTQSSDFCELIEEGEDLIALQESSLEDQVEYFDDGYKAMAEKIASDFPNMIPIYFGLQLNSEFEVEAQAAIKAAADYHKGHYFNISGTATGSSRTDVPNVPKDILGNPPHIVNHAMFQRIVSVACEADEETDTECEEQLIGGSSCQSYIVAPDSTQPWSSHYHRGCELTSFTRDEAPPPTPPGSAPSPGGAPITTLPPVEPGFSPRGRFTTPAPVLDARSVDDGTNSASASFAQTGGRAGMVAVTVAVGVVSQLLSRFFV